VNLRLFVLLAIGVFHCEAMAQSSASRLEGTVIFKVKPEFRSLCAVDKIEYAALSNLMAVLGTCELNKIYPLHQPPRTRYNPDGLALADLSLIYELTYTGDVMLEKVIRSISNFTITEYAQPHYLPKPLYIPNDNAGNLASQYHLSNIRAFEAWDSIKGDSNVVIGITDTGIDTAHIDLKGNIKYNYADPLDGIDNDNDGFIDNYRGWDMADWDNDPTSTGIYWHHGTAVAGLAAASTDNGIHGAGVGFMCKFLPIKVSKNIDGEFSAAYEGIVYAADHGCQIINCSWGGVDAAGQYEQDIIDYATLNKNALVIAACGNDGTETPYYPASLNYVISVGGTDSNDVKFDIPSGPSSTYGTLLDICAPGAYIYSSTVPSTFNAVNSGTSYSSPILAGCAAIVKSKFPNYTGLQVGMQLKVTAYNIDTVAGNELFKNKLGTGRVDLFNAITDTSNPWVGIIKHTFSDGGDGLFTTGETISIAGTFKNYLASTAGKVYVRLDSIDDKITILPSVVALDTLDMLDTAGNYGNPLQFIINPSAGFDEPIDIRLLYTDLDTIGYDVISLTVNPTLVDIAVNNISTTMTSVGRIGYEDSFPMANRAGLGFRFKGEQLIYEAGLMVGAQIGGNTYVSDNISDSLTPDVDYESVVKAMTVSSVLADIETNAVINDDGAGTDKMDISVDHTYYAWSNSPDENYVMMNFDIINNGGDTLTDLYAGLSTDWDIRNYALNKATHDNGRRLGYVRSTEPGSPFGGVKLLSDGPYLHYAIDNYAGAPGIDIYYPNAYSTAKKYIALSTNRVNAGGSSGKDVMDVVSSGPFTLVPQDTVTVSFAMVAGEDLLELINGASAAQAMYDSLFGEPEDTTAMALLSYESQIELFPNPSQGLVTLYFSDAPACSATLEIIDLTGHIVYVSEVGLRSAKSTHDISALKAGVYQYRLRFTGLERNGKLVVVQ